MAVALVVGLAVVVVVVVVVAEAMGRVVVEAVVGGSLRGRTPVAKVVHPPKKAKRRLACGGWGRGWGQW